MISYINRNGNSGVKAYEILSDAIRVQFSSGSTYVYSYRSAGIEKVEQMKALAKSGHGLNSFIMLEAKFLYERI